MMVFRINTNKPSKAIHWLYRPSHFEVKDPQNWIPSGYAKTPKRQNARLREGLRSPLFLSNEMVNNLCRAMETLRWFEMTNMERPTEISYLYHIYIIFISYLYHIYITCINLYQLIYSTLFWICLIYEPSQLRTNWEVAHLIIPWEEDERSRVHGDGGDEKRWWTMIWRWSESEDHINLN